MIAHKLCKHGDVKLMESKGIVPIGIHPEVSSPSPDRSVGIGEARHTSVKSSREDGKIPTHIRNDTTTNNKMCMESLRIRQEEKEKLLKLLAGS